MFKSKPSIDNLDHYLARKEYDLALAALADAIKRHRDNTSLRLRQAEVMVMAGDLEGAIERYTEIAHEYIEQGFYARAIAVANKILRVDPERTAVSNELAKLIASQQAADREAKARLRRAATPKEEVQEAAPQAEAPEAEVVEVEIEEEAATPVEPGARTAEEEARERDASQFFAAFPAAALEELLSVTAVRSFEVGDVIVNEGEPGTSLFLLADGHVVVRTADPGGRDVTLARLGPGDFFGEVSVLTGRPRTATIVADDAVTVIEIQRDVLIDIFSRHPGVERVLRDFYEERAQATATTMLARLRGQGD